MRAVRLVCDTDEFQQRHAKLDRGTFLGVVARGAHQGADHGGSVPGVEADDHVLQRGHLTEEAKMFWKVRAMPARVILCWCKPLRLAPFQRHEAPRMACRLRSSR